MADAFCSDADSDAEKMGLISGSGIEPVRRRNRWTSSVVYALVGLLVNCAIAALLFCVLPGYNLVAAAGEHNGALAEAAALLLGDINPSAAASKWDQSRIKSVVALSNDQDDLTKGLSAIIADEGKFTEMVNKMINETDMDGSGSIEDGELRHLLTNWADSMGLAQPTQEDVAAIRMKLGRPAGEIQKAELEPIVKDMLVDLAGFFRASTYSQMIAHLEHYLGHTDHVSSLNHAVFVQSDMDGNGLIDRGEFKGLMDMVTKDLDLEKPTEREQAELRDDLDTAGTGGISEAELKPLIRKMLSDAVDTLKVKLAKQSEQRHLPYAR